MPSEIRATVADMLDHYAARLKLGEDPQAVARDMVDSGANLRIEESDPVGWSLAQRLIDVVAAIDAPGLACPVGDVRG